MNGPPCEVAAHRPSALVWGSLAVKSHGHSRVAFLLWQEGRRSPGAPSLQGPETTEGRVAGGRQETEVAWPRGGGQPAR